MLCIQLNHHENTIGFIKTDFCLKIWLITKNANIKLNHFPDGLAKKHFVSKRKTRFFITCVGKNKLHCHE